MAETTCTAPGCDRPTRSTRAEYCELHRQRLMRTGTLDAKPWHRRGICVMDDCETPERYSGLCNKHLSRVRRHGSPDIVLSPTPAHITGVDHWCWVGDDIGYNAMHFRIRDALGSARDQLCVDCGEQARDWSYDNTDPDERTSNQGRYSVHLEHYVPRCRPCHRRFDNQAALAS